MIFTEPLAAAIVRGEKTQTRRRISPNPRSPWREPGGMAHDRVWTYPVGKVFTVNPGRGVRRVAECMVTGRRLQAVVDITDAEAHAEGFPHRRAFFDAWGKINCGSDAAERVHVVTFRLVGLECLLCDDGEGCPDCFGTGVDVTPEARELFRKLEREAK